MRTRRHSRSSVVIDPEEALPAELEARIAALERADPREDFDRVSWIWMLLFGVALPAALAFFGWRL